MSTTCMSLNLLANTVTSSDNHNQKRLCRMCRWWTIWQSRPNEGRAVEFTELLSGLRDYFNSVRALKRKQYPVPASLTAEK